MSGAIMLFQTASEKKAVDMHAQSTQEFRDNQHLSRSKQMGIPVNQQPPKAFPCQKFVNKRPKMSLISISFGHLLQ
jgi:hypothetical protein